MNILKLLIREFRVLLVLFGMSLVFAFSSVYVPGYVFSKSCLEKSATTVAPCQVTATMTTFIIFWTFVLSYGACKGILWIAKFIQRRKITI